MATKRKHESVKPSKSLEIKVEIPPYVFDMVLDELNPSDWTVWHPYPRTGLNFSHMQTKGFEMISDNGIDFLEAESLPPASPGRKLLIIVVPPFPLKQQVVRKLFALKAKNIALLTPLRVFECHYFTEYFPQDSNQLIVHQQNCAFLDPKTYKYGKRTPFHIGWVLNGIKLRKDLIYKRRQCIDYTSKDAA